jgi:hypothetical protein
MNEEKITVCLLWIEHPTLKGVRRALLFEGFYCADGELVSGAFHKVGVFKIAG